MKNKSAFLPLSGWVLSGVTVALAIIAWGQGIDWQFDKLSTYELFPVFGLTAFSLMWVHYIIAALRTYLKVSADVTKKYFNYSSFLVLIAFVIHPSLLVWQLWRDGFGLPPQSYLNNYVPKQSQLAVFIGSFSLFVFLFYELRYRFSKRSWWKYVQLLSDGAMIGIFFHALRLGKNVQDGWYRGVWIFYGISLLLSLAYLYAAKFQARSHKVPTN